jgi:hypothetical protein
MFQMTQICPTASAYSDGINEMGFGGVDKLTPEEVERRENETLRRMLATPPEKHKPLGHDATGRPTRKAVEKPE